MSDTAAKGDDLRSAMPIISGNEGVWQGWYRYYNIAGEQTDAHRSTLICRLPDSGPYPYHQTNIYEWEDGRRDVRDFPASYRAGRLWFDNDLIYGWAAEVELDEARRTSMLHWTRKGQPDLYLYEMIHNSDCGNYRARVWQWIKAGQTHMRTLIDEERVTHDWRVWERDNPL